MDYFRTNRNLENRLKTFVAQENARFEAIKQARKWS